MYGAAITQARQGDTRRCRGAWWSVTLEMRAALFLCLVTLCAATQMMGKRTLVVTESSSIQQSHSQFFEQLQGQWAFRQRCG